jgi:hypothetical protein
LPEPDPERVERRFQRHALMRSTVASCHRLVSYGRGSTLVGYSSLMLLVAIAAIALLGQTDAANERLPRNAMTPLADRP